MTDYSRILNYFYPEADRLRDILFTHSKGVARHAIAIVDRHPELHADRDIVLAGAMVHDIGIRYCDAPGICCHGTHPYICHGTLGGKMLRSNASTLGLSEVETETLARICERHTGTGLTKAQIISQRLPLPPCDLVPETIEEQIICYADKFFSKTRPAEMKQYEKAVASLRKFGEEGIKIFEEWHKLFLTRDI